MPQPKSRKIAILGYRSVGECRTQLDAGVVVGGVVRRRINVHGLWFQLSSRRLRLPVIIGCDDGK